MVGLILGSLGVLLGIIIGIGTLTGFFIPLSATEKILKMPLAEVFEKTIEIYSMWTLKGVGIILLSVIGAIGTGFLVLKPEVGSLLMCIAGIGGFLISVPLYALFTSPLFLVGGILNNDSIINFLKRLYKYLFPPPE